MTGHTITAHSTRRRPKRGQSVEFGLIYAISFIVLLAAVVVRRSVGLVTWRKRNGPDVSIFKEARESAGATVPYAFMG
jgi:hypothetical protein